MEQLVNLLASFHVKLFSHGVRTQNTQKKNKLWTGLLSITTLKLANNTGFLFTVVFATLQDLVSLGYRPKTPAHITLKMPMNSLVPYKRLFYAYFSIVSCQIQCQLTCRHLLFSFFCKYLYMFLKSLYLGTYLLVLTAYSASNPKV